MPDANLLAHIETLVRDGVRQRRHVYLALGGSFVLLSFAFWLVPLFRTSRAPETDLPLYLGAVMTLIGLALIIPGFLDRSTPRTLDLLRHRAGSIVWLAIIYVQARQAAVRAAKITIGTEDGARCHLTIPLDRAAELYEALQRLAPQATAGDTPELAKQFSADPRSLRRSGIGAAAGAPPASASAGSVSTPRPNGSGGRPPRTPAEEVVATLDHVRGWFEHLGPALRAAAPDLDPDGGRALLRQLQALDAGYQLGHELVALRYRDRAHDDEVARVVATMRSYLDQAFAAGRTAIAAVPEHYMFWVVCSLEHPCPYRDVPSAVAAADRAQFLDLHDLDELSQDDLFGIGDLDSLVVLDAGATGLTARHLEEIGFGALPRLRSLDLSENPLGAIPAGVWRAPALEHLSLRATELSDLPADLPDARALRCLDLRKTRVTPAAAERLRRARPGLAVLL